jgi:hypothetical protein
MIKARPPGVQGCFDRQRFIYDSFLAAEIERIPSVRTVGQEHAMTRPETNETLRKFNRDTRAFCVGLLGILFLAAWACLALIQERHPPNGDVTEITSQAKSDSSPTADTTTLFTRTESSPNMSSGAVTSVKSPLADQRPTERSSKESLGWTEIAGGSTASPVFVLSPESSQPSDRANQRESLLSDQPNSAQTFRRKAPYQSHRSARELGDAEAKRRLIELWHQSLARTEKEKARSWAMFSKLERKKKAAFTVRKQP